VSVHEGSATLNGTQVVSNSASYNGGGVFVQYGSTTLNGGEVVSNSADRYGGGVYVDSGSATLNGTQVVSNLARYGGGVYLERVGATLNVSGGEISNNSVVTSGGGVYVYWGSATLSETQVLSNSAYDGGGVYVWAGSATFTDGCIVYNSDTAVENNSIATLNARDNWWGMPDGPSGAGPGSGDSVSMNVDYADHKTSPPAGCPKYRPGLTIAKSVTPTTDAAYHGAVTYTVRLDNGGWASDTDVLFTDTLPSKMDFGAFVSADHGARVDNDELTWTGTVAAGEALTWTFAALHTGGYGDVVTNTAEFSGALQAGDDDVVFTVVEPHTIFLPLVLRDN